MLRVECSAILMILSLTSLGAQAEGLKVTPGKWEIRVTTTMPMMPQPVENIGTQCISDSEMKPDELLRNSGECTFSEVTASGSDFSWAMRCKREEAELTGTGTFTSQGDQMSGVVKMEILSDGQKMSVANTWEGKRIGPCD